MEDSEFFFKWFWKFNALWDSALKLPGKEESDMCWGMCLQMTVPVVCNLDWENWVDVKVDLVQQMELQYLL